MASAQARDWYPLCMQRMASPDVVYQNISERSEFSGAAPVASLPKSTDLHQRCDGASRCLYNKNPVERASGSWQLPSRVHGESCNGEDSEEVGRSWEKGHEAQ